MDQERKEPAFLVEPRTVLEPGASVTGKLIYDAPVKIDGRFKGEIKANSLLVLGPQAEVAANISAGQLRIEGSFIGTVSVKGWIEILPGGRFQGEIHSGKLKIYAGAVFEGNAELGAAYPASSS
jgi:cytoskeletal protein CcmA (bactofilin family)